jgi:hypothetical protein
MKKIIFFILMMIIMNIINAQQLQYPKTKKVDIVENYHGTMVADPYRWLEDENSPETKQWIQEQNKLTFSYLEKIPFRENIMKKYGISNVWAHHQRDKIKFIISKTQVCKIKVFSTKKMLNLA